MYRVGIGHDTHRTEVGGPLRIGGIDVPHDRHMVGHSDADVLIHVICDALLGAANMRDIGFHFPDTDPEYKGIDSKKLLARVMEMIREKGYEIGNVDSVICLQKPKISHLIPEMQACLAEVMQVELDQVSIKATTTEKLGFVGKEEGISAHATVLIVKE